MDSFSVRSPRVIEFEHKCFESLAETMGKRKGRLCTTCSIITIEQLATKGYIHPLTSERIKSSGKSCPLCSFVFQVLQIQSLTDAHLEITQPILRLSPGYTGAPNHPLRFFTIGMSNCCTADCNGEADLEMDFTRCQGKCRLKCSRAMRICTLKGKYLMRKRFCGC
jgi:hypothetical protein